jgi:hypothetical protein
MYAFDIKDIIILLLLIILIFSFLGINKFIITTINKILSYIEYIFGTTAKTGVDILRKTEKTEMDLEILKKLNEHNNLLDKHLLKSPTTTSNTPKPNNSTSPGEQYSKRSCYQGYIFI